MEITGVKLLLTLVEIISETVNERRKGGKLGLMVQIHVFLA